MEARGRTRVSCVGARVLVHSAVPWWDVGTSMRRCWAPEPRRCPDTMIVDCWIVHTLCMACVCRGEGVLGGMLKQLQYHRWPRGD